MKRDWVAVVAFLLGGFTVLAACGEGQEGPSWEEEERAVERCIDEGGIPSFTQSENGLYVERYLGCTKAQADA